MQQWIFRRASLLALLAMLCAVPAFAESPYRELPNFQKVTERLYRGGQPGKGGVQRLAELGVTTIVNLRGEDELSRREQREAQALGLRYYAIPMGGLSRPNDKDIERALEIIKAPENGVIFIHCKHGADRTGTVIACYRISQESYSVEKAREEAEKYGMSWVQFGMKRYIDDYYNRCKRTRPAPEKAVGETGEVKPKAVSWFADESRRSTVFEKFASERMVSLAPGK